MAPEVFPSDKAVLTGGSTYSPPARRAYVTFLAGNGDYVKGVVGLAKGLRKVKSAYPLVVAVLPDVPPEHRRMMTGQGCIVREIEPIYPPENQTRFAMAYYVINYSKLRIWNFDEYSKMIYLDADIQVYDNVDHLFDSPDGYFYAVKDCFCEQTWSHTPQYGVGYCQQCPNKVTWPADEEMGPPPPLYFNAGMFVFEPCRDTCASLLDRLAVSETTPFAEQDFLNVFFRDKYKPIPVVYNLVLAMLWLHPENVDVDEVKIVHYCAAGSKPWRYTGKEENMDRGDIKMLVEKWWEIYNDKSLDSKPNHDHHRNYNHYDNITSSSDHNTEVDHHDTNTNNNNNLATMAISSRTSMIMASMASEPSYISAPSAA
ncbi:Galactinol synthase 1 [Linum perenne]